MPSTAPVPVTVFRAATAAQTKAGSRAARARVKPTLPPKPATSPYQGLALPDYVDRTRALINHYPLGVDELIDVVLLSWDQIFESQIGGYTIGREIFLSPQAMGSLMHELVPLNLAAKDPDSWRRERTGAEKDIVNLKDDRFSTEIKTSSSGQQVFGNRSFAQESEGDGKKLKSGYYLAVNFDKFPREVEVGKSYKPPVRLIRFGWLDHIDWTGQDKPSGQQSALAAEIEDRQLLALFQE